MGRGWEGVRGEVWGGEEVREGCRDVWEVYTECWGACVVVDEAA